MAGGLLVAVKLKEQGKRTRLVVDILHQHLRGLVHGLMEHILAELIGDQRDLKSAGVTIIRSGHKIRHVVGVECRRITLGVHGQVDRSGNGDGLSVCNRSVLADGKERVMGIFEPVFDLVRSIGRHCHTSISYMIS